MLLPVDLEGRISELLGAGDLHGAATEALRGLGPAIIRYLRSLLRDEADAGEAFSQFAENLWRGLPAFRGEASFRTWAYRLAWNAALDVRDGPWRRRGRRFRTGEASALANDIRTKSAVVVERQRQALEQLRSALSVEDQSLLVLRVDHGLSWTEIAQVKTAEGARPVEAAALMKRFERLKEKLARLAREQGLLE
jgi:RNA polymerase sigma-70 factor (ECF subfamily)